MAGTLEIRSLAAGEILATQGEEAAEIYVLQSGELASKLVPTESRADTQAMAAADSLEIWNDEATILAAESVMVGHYIESIVATQASEVLVVPITRAGVVQLFASAPLTALSFGRSLARKIVHANQNLSQAQSGAARLEKQLEGIYTRFYTIVNGIQKDADGDDLVMDAIKNARGSKTYSMGQRLSGETTSNASEMTRVIESYEMTGNQHKIKKGEALCRAGDPGNSMFIITKGKLRVVINGDKVGEIEAGQTVGEVAILIGGDQTRSADLIAEENTVVAIIPGDQFPKLVQVQPALLLQVLGVLTKRIESNYSIVADRDTREQKAIAKYLAKAGYDPEGDYRELAEKLDNLIEEYDLTSLLQQFDQLDRGAEKIAELKEEYAELIGAEES